jgi:pyruvate formate lyase activating enzyme
MVENGVKFMKFRGWQRTSLIEYPGRISSVVFTGSCNFRCPFCYNRDLVLNPGKFPEIDESAVLDYMKQNIGLYHALVVTGGEPTMHRGLPLFLRKLKKLGFLIGIETNGTNPAMISEMIRKNLVDFVGMDIKAPLVFEKYRLAAGISDKRLFEAVKKSVKILLGPGGSGIDYEFRTTVVPGIHSEKDIIEISKHIKGAKKYVLQQFLPKNPIDEKFRNVKPFPFGKLVNLRENVKKHVVACEIRNV